MKKHVDVCANLNEKNRLCQIFAAPKNQNGIDGKQELKKHTMVAWVRTPPKARYDSVGTPTRHQHSV
jgi:hypothetical protein